MSLVDLAVYHLRPWLFAAAVIAPFAIRAWRRPRRWYPADVDRNPETRARRAMGAGS